MNSEEKSEILKNLVSEILEKMTFENFKVNVARDTSSDEESFVVNIETAESNLLIGQYGVSLKALQHIARLLVRFRTDEKIKFLLDVNNYLQQKTNSLLEIARNAAVQAINERKPVILRPMSAYERRIVHLELAENENIKTESIGEGEARKVVIKPVGDLEKIEKET